MAKKEIATGKRPPLDRESVLRAAVELADAEGIEALSMRKLGHKLGVEAMSLYNHVSNKDDVLAGIVDIIVGSIHLDPSSPSWRETMRGRALSMREVFRGHPWALGLLEARRNMGPVALSYCEAVLAVLRRVGFRPAWAMRTFSALDSYVYGYCIQEKNLPSSSPAQAKESTELFLEQLPDQGFPCLAEVAAEFMSADYDFAKEFELGLDLLLDALESWRNRE